jgi:hypothetical protein
MLVHDVSSDYQGAYGDMRTRTDYIVIHHAAWSYPPGIAALDDVHDYHTDKWGTGVGYHECLIEEIDGRIACYVTSDPALLRYGVAYQNGRSFHISALTNFSNTIPEQKWIDAFASRVAVARQRWPNARIVGHKEIAVSGWETSCPGHRWHEWKPQLLGTTNTPVAPDWYTVPRRVVATVRYQPEVQGTRNIGGMLSPGSNIHIAEWQGDWGRLSNGGWVHKSGVEW